MAREIEKEFAMKKKYTTIKTGSKINISNDKLEVHFKEYLAERTSQLDIPPEIDQQENFTHLNNVKFQVNEEQPIEGKWKMSLKHLKITKVLGQTN